MGRFKTYQVLKIVLIAAILLQYVGVNAQITFSSDTGRIAWGERATITARLGMEATDNIMAMDSFPNWVDTIPGGLEILETKGPDRTLPMDTDPSEWDYVMEKSWVVTAWDSGYVSLPGMQIQIIPTRTENAQEIIGHADIIDVEWTASEKLQKVLPYMLISLIALMVLISGWFGYKKWKNKGEKLGVLEPVIILPAHIVALEKLEKLKERAAWTKGDAKTFQVELSRILREYIDRRFGVKSLDKTSNEAVEIIRILNISEGDQQAVIGALLLGDQIKFAKFNAATDLHSKSLNACIDFVKNTMEDEVD